MLMPAALFVVAGTMTLGESNDPQTVQTLILVLSLPWSNLSCSRNTDPCESKASRSISPNRTPPPLRLPAINRNNKGCIILPIKMCLQNAPRKENEAGSREEAACRQFQIIFMTEFWRFRNFSQLLTRNHYPLSFFDA